MRSRSAFEALATVRSGQRVFIQGVCAVPHVLLDALVQHAPRLRDVEIVQLHTEGPAPYADPAYAESFRVNCLFIGANLRAAVQEGRADYTPVFLSDIPSVLRDGPLTPDVALIHVSPPDAHGYCSLGVTVEAAHAAVHRATTVIAQINPRMPRTHGDALIHRSQITIGVEVDVPLPEHASAEPTDDERRIGEHVASLVPDGATLQMGIGALPDAVLRSLTHHRDLGIHTEMFSDGLIDLVERGVVNGARKTIHPRRIVATFVMGTQRTYTFIDDNPNVTMLDVAYVNNPHVIRRNPAMTSINSAIEVDLTGQVCADSIGTRPYSGVGGQIDFMRGAALSPGGRPIIALPSRTSKGRPRIASVLQTGAGVVTTRAHVHTVVTEYGIAELHGRSLAARAQALIGIAHPDDRERLAREARDTLRLRLPYATLPR